MSEVYRGEARYEKRSGGPGMFAQCVIELEALPRGSGFEFVDLVVGGAIPKHFLPAIEKGIQNGMARGILAGFPVVDVRVTVVGGAWHEVDSNPLAFEIAGLLAFRDACRRAPMVILEPISRAEILTPPEYLGSVMGDVHRRRGRLEQQSTLPDGTSVITACIPVAETFGYATELRSMTQGRASAGMTPNGYEEVPDEIQRLLMA
jgi:elongation factor G